MKRVILCTGKIYYDLTADREEDGGTTAVVRVEMLYPFPATEIAGVLASYPGATEIVWAQEEPRNMGAWQFIEPRLRELVGDRPIRYAGRPIRASPAEGFAEVHEAEQKRIVEDAMAPTGGKKGKSAKSRK